MMHLGRYIVLLRLVLSQHSTWTALVMGFRLSRPGLTYKQHIRGGFGRGAAGYHRERKDVVVCMQANPQYSRFAEGARKYNSTGDEKCKDVECPIDDEIDDVTKHLRERIPELFLFGKEEYEGPTQVRRSPLTNYYYPLEHPDISVQFLPSCGDPGYEEGEYNDAIGIQEKKKCEANTLLKTQISPSNNNNISSSLPTENRHSTVEKEGNSTKEKAGSLPFGVMGTVEVSRCNQTQKTLTFTGKHESSQSSLSVVGCDETADGAFDTRRRGDNIVPGSWNIANSVVTNPPIPKAEHSIEVGALDALLEKQIKNCQETKKKSQVGCSQGQLPVTAPENNGDEKEQKNVTTAVNMNPITGATLSTPVIPTNVSLSNSNYGPVLEANESSADSSYHTQDELRERQVVENLKDKQQSSSFSPSAHAKVGAANMDDNAIANIIDVSTKNAMKGLLADGNSTVLSSAPLFPPSKNLMDMAQVSSASNVGIGHPIEMAGVWQIDSLLLMSENGSVASGLAKTCLTERDPQDSLVLRIDGQVSGGPVIAPQAVVRWSDPKGCRCCGGRWVVYKDENGTTRLRIILFGNQERTSGLAMDGTVLMMREWDHLESRYVVMPHVVGHVSEVEERESIHNVQGTAMAQRKLGECSLCKISIGGLDRLSLAVPEPKSILT